MDEKDALPKVREELQETTRWWIEAVAGAWQAAVPLGKGKQPVLRTVCRVWAG